MSNVQPMNAIEHSYTDQLNLFTKTWGESFPNDSHIRHKAKVLFNKGYLSFDPDEKAILQDFEINELSFLTALLLDSGLPEEISRAMLAQLKRPYYYSFRDIFWDFQDSRWKKFWEYVERLRWSTIKEEIQYDTHKILEAFDVDELRDLRNTIDEVIETRKERPKDNSSH